MAKQSIKLKVGYIFQKVDRGNYYYRYQVNKKRKTISLGTKNKEEAAKKAEEMIPVIEASSVEVIAAHVNIAKGWAKKEETIELYQIWGEYEKHPQRATPATKAIWQRYESYLNEFIKYAKSKDIETMSQVTEEITLGWSDSLRKQQIGVDTHNKKISRVKSIFKTLSKYYSHSNPFAPSSLKRSNRDEAHNTVRRLPFTKVQEQAIFDVFSDESYTLLNKAEIEILFYIGAYTGQRMKDCALLQWANIDLQKRVISVNQFKTGVGDDTN